MFKEKISKLEQEVNSALLKIRAEETKINPIAKNLNSLGLLPIGFSISETEVIYYGKITTVSYCQMSKNVNSKFGFFIYTDSNDIVAIEKCGINKILECESITQKLEEKIEYRLDTILKKVEQNG